MGRTRLHHLLGTGILLSALAPWLAGQQLLQEPCRALEAQIGGTWRQHRHPATGTPEWIYGTGQRLTDWRGSSLTEARRHALQALSTYRELLGLGNAEYREEIGARMGNAWTFTFAQHVRGLRCIGGRADVRIHESGVLSSLGSVAYPVPESFDILPKWDANAAAVQAWLALGEVAAGQAPPASAPAQLVLWTDLIAAAPGPIHLAWEVPIHNLDRAGQGKIGRAYIDAKDGAFLHFQSDRHECGMLCSHRSTLPDPRTIRRDRAHPNQPRLPIPTTVTVQAWTRTAASALAPLSNVPMPGLVVQVPGVGTFTTDAQGQFTANLQAPTTITIANLDGIHHAPIQGLQAPQAATTVLPGQATTIQLLSSAATATEAAHPTVQHWVHSANEWLRTIVGNGAQMNILDGIAPYVNEQGSCNAWYSGNTIHFYGAGGSCNNMAFSTVVLHEWGHGLDDRFGGISNAPSEGLSEGWADLVALYHPAIDAPQMALDWTGSGSQMRSGLNGTLYHTQTEVHAAGEVWMGFGWRVRENLRAAYGTPQAMAISNAIVLGSITANATDQAGAVLQVFLADDDNGNLLDGTPHFAQLAPAAIAKGLPYPGDPGAYLTYTPIANTSNLYEPSELTAVAGASLGSFSQVRVLYSVNGGPIQTRPMIPDGSPSGFHALLPGLTQSPSWITYHIEADHSSGLRLRQPAVLDAAFSAVVPALGPFVPFYREDCEHGAPGWTHSANGATQRDDWQLGVPAGSSGIAGTRAWSDPGPSSSSLAFGTELGLAGSGAYGANLDCSLRSPWLDCSSRTNCYLRFRRWLTVQQAPLDRAILRVNGWPVWTNQVATDLVDSQWQTVEVPIPQANRNPAVQIEWQLASDGALEFGGWNLDDIELGTRNPPLLPATLRLLPEQPTTGTPVQVLVQIDPGQLFVFALGTSAGPTVLPGIPELAVGGAMLTLLGFTDAQGAFATSFSAPGVTSPSGSMWFAQVLALDASQQIVRSNPSRILFTR